ncbi:MAG: hypothetical protein PVJ49_12130 [Acidobacteriota bacterium]
MRSSRMWTAILASAFLVIWFAAGTAHAAPQQSTQIEQLQRRVADLEATIATMRTDYDARLAAIEAQLAQLAGAPAAEAQPEEPAAAGGEAMTPEERAELEAELAGILGEQQPEQAGAGEQLPPAQGSAPGGTQRFSSQTRMLNRLNPEISATGDLLGIIADNPDDPESNQFQFGEFELLLQSTLDPYSTSKFAIVQEDGGFSLEEGYMEYTSLPGRLGVKAGQMRLDWGKLNRYHQHALPQSDRPLVHQAFFGEDGLTGLGASTSWLPPAFLGDYNEVIVQVVNDTNDVAFAGRGFGQPVYLLHETNYFDISDASYFELGFSATTGAGDLTEDFNNTIYGTDWNYSWVPPDRSLYRGFELRGELMYERRGGPDGVTDYFGTYTYGTFKFSQRSFVGMRGDWTQLPQEPGESIWGVSPYFDWWQSEWVRFRVQYSYWSRQFDFPEPESKFYFQLTWAMGPHKHENY